MTRSKIEYVGKTIPNSNFDYSLISDFSENDFRDDCFYIFDKEFFENNKIQFAELVEFKNYVLSDIFEKKIVVLYGNCHIIPIKFQLEAQKDFFDRYFIFPIPPICLINDDEFFNEPVFSCFCDVFIHQDIRDDNMYGPNYSSKSIINKLPKKCKIYAIPNLYRMPIFQFPQNIINKGLFYKNKKVFSYDSILDNWVKSHLRVMSPKEYIRRLNKLNSDYDTNLGSFLAKIRTREEKWDIKISDFIIDNLDKQLFYDPNHPTDLVLDFITSKLCELLSVGFKKAKTIFLDDVEMPSIYNVNSGKQLKMRKHCHSFCKTFLNLKEYISLYSFLNYQNIEITNKYKKKYLKLRFYMILMKFKCLSFLKNI